MCALLLLVSCTPLEATQVTAIESAPPITTRKPRERRPTKTPKPTKTPTMATTPEPAAPLPETFDSEVLRGGIDPVQYMQGSCEYLGRRWDPAGALPGTVVAPIMFHSILEGNGTPTLSQDINFKMFEDLIRQAEDLGYETITTKQLLNFLLKNAKIPPRSMILILDDRRPGTVEDYFLPILEKNDWTLTLAWIAQSDTAQRKGRLPGESLWDWMERLDETGYLDVQSHGLNHIYLDVTTVGEAVREEIAGSIPVLKEHFGKAPLAYIWPGGNYTALGLQVAHEAGFELGFTIHSRGPILFNWIPQGEPERAFDDPLMLLPRYWDTAAWVNLQQAAQIGDAAQAFAKDNYAAEAAWYRQNCGGELPVLDEVFKP